MSIDSGISEHPKLFTHGCVLISCREESMHDCRGKPWPWKDIPYFFKLYSGGPRVFLWLASGSKKFAYSYKEIFAPCYFKFSLRSSFLKVMWYCTHTHYTHMYAHIYTHMSVYGKKTDWISDSPLLSLMFKGFYNSVSTCPSKTHVGIYSQCNHAARWSPMGMFTVKAPERDCLSSRHRSAGAWFPGSCEALFSHKSHQNGSGFRVMGLQLSSVFLPPLQKMQY